jgi:hypothetical protein
MSITETRLENLKKKELVLQSTSAKTIDIPPRNTNVIFPDTEHDANDSNHQRSCTAPKNTLNHANAAAKNNTNTSDDARVRQL